jgi:predicted  nucleic acid-binding Zn-ribbon protein
MTLNLVKGEFSSLEEALRAQVQKLQEHNEKLQIQYKALETKHKNLRACVSGMTQQLRELEGPWDEELDAPPAGQKCQASASTCSCCRP